MATVDPDIVGSRRLRSDGCSFTLKRSSTSQSTFVWLELDRPCRLHAICSSDSVVVWTLPSATEHREDAFTPTTLCADPIACRHPHDLLPEWCKHSSKALASPCRDSQAPCDSDLLPARTGGSLHLLHSSFSHAVPRRLALHRLFLDEFAWSICHRRQDRQSHVDDHGCFSIRSHDVSLVSTGRQLLVEDFDVSFTVALALKQPRKIHPSRPCQTGAPRPDAVRRITIIVLP